MNSLRLTCLAFVVFHFSPLFSQSIPATGADQSVEKIETEFEARYEQSVNRPYKEKLAELNLGYSQALDRALETATKAARLEEALALRTEKERFSLESDLPQGDDPGTIASLAKLRTTYRTERLKLDQARDQIIVPLLAELDANLEAHQAFLTKEGRLEEALAVKQAREAAATRMAPKPGGDRAATSPNPDSAANNDGWELIFDGSDLKSWKPAESSRNFRLADGILAAKRETDGPDHLIFQGNGKVPAVLRNFELKATTKADPTANSGFYFHINERISGPKGFPEDGIEVSLYNGPRTARFPTGTLHGLTPEAHTNLDQSTWFELYFKVQDETVTVSLNGKPYLEYVAPLATDDQPKGIRKEGGRLAIQANSKDGAFYFQKISVRILD